jgi:hypothetical protein
VLGRRKPLRMLALIAVGVGLAACSTTPPPPSVPLTSMAGGTQVRFPTGAANPETAELNKRLLLQMA